LSEEGLLFTRLYSNGTRSIRGISGTVAGFLSTPGQGVVKRNQSQSGFFTVASLLKPHGYRSSFFYGGESRFDNMKSWFFGNGFDEIYDEPTFTEAAFHGTWGVSDEDLVVKANQLFSEWNKAGEPFVSVLFTTTNHSPFEFPEGRIELLPGVPANSDKNAIKFADYAIGKFIDLAKENGYYDDTVIMIIADHNVRVYGDDIIPVDTFRVPALILGGGVTPERVEQLVTQPDALATALDLLGLDLAYPILGNSIFSDRQTGVSLLQFHELYGLRYEDEIAIIQPDKPAETYRVTAEDHLEPAAHNTALEKDALAFVVVLDYLYRNRLYTTAPVISK
jgi:phosphoglycerol transferase MdoB-like AlkP superfamily enzyme